MNVKADPEWRDFWRKAYPSVLPGYHQNKTHWNSIILDGSIPEREIKRMIGESYDLIAGAQSGSRKQTVKVIANVHGQQGRAKDLLAKTGNME